MRRIAEEAGTSTRAVYALFDSKEGLEQALHQAMFTRLRDLLQACEPTDDPRRDIALQSLAYRQWAVERPERYALAMHRFVGQRLAAALRRRPGRVARGARRAAPGRAAAATTPACCSAIATPRTS